MPAGDILATTRAWRDYTRAVKEGAGADAAVPVIGIASSFTADAIEPYLGGHLLQRELPGAEILFAPYNQIIQTTIDHKAAFGGRELDVLIVLWRLEDMFPTHLQKPLTELIAGHAQLQAELDAILAGLTQLRANFSGTLIVSTPPYPASPSFELNQLQQSGHGSALFARLLQHWLTGLSAIDRTLVVDLHGLLMEHGYRAATEPRKWHLYKQPYDDGFLWALGERLARMIVAQTRSRKKCVVLDCDNTLWGGILGEDGLDGIQIGDDFPGSAFRDFQKYVLHLKNSGIFLAIASKNNPEDVDEVFEELDSMVLSSQDISVFQVHWRSKVESITAIAEQLNIGIDSIVFVDDSAKEIAEVRERLPEVICLQVPDELAELPDLLRHTDLFDSNEQTSEDAQRVEMMAAESQRKQVAASLTEDEFRQSLELCVDIFEVERAHLARVTQLINKTNQFNLTTRRKTADEVAELSASDSHTLLAMNVKDRFGDYGLVGVAILDHRNGDACEIETLLMSCRVLGRGVETVFLAKLAEVARKSNVKQLVGRYLPTKKNVLVESLYEDHGFSPVGDTWVIATDAHQECPAHVTVSLSLLDG